MRVSTDQQDTDNQKGAILEYANKHDLGKVDFISETISSRKTDRLIYSLIEKLKQGDHLVIFELSRLARSMKELESIRVKIAEKGATIHAISNNFIISPDGDDIPTQALIFAFSISAQIERQMISDRTKNALQARKSKGLPMGRPAGISKLDDKETEIKKYLSMGVNPANLSRILGCNRQTLVNWLTAHKM